MSEHEKVIDEPAMEDGSRGNSSTTDASLETGVDIVEFEYGDPDNPFNWPAWKKIPMVIAVSLMNALG